jgi:hypothetical protein
MPSLLIDSPSSKNDVANWVEFFICATKSNLSKAELSSFLESSSGSEPDNIFIDDVWQELTGREFLYGENPPFRVDFREVVCTLNWKELPEYLTCVILSIDGNTVNASSTGKLFERLSCKAIKNYMGGDAIIYGFPQKQSVEEIARSMNEKFNMRPSPNFKDSGVDIISWKSFGDNRKSQIVGLFQCAAGYNWNKKLLQIPLNRWKQYILWSDTFPIKGFTTPVFIDEDIFHDTVTDAGLMFDRPRLYRHIQKSTDEDQSLKRELIDWCNDKINLLNN